MKWISNWGNHPKVNSNILSLGDGDVVSEAIHSFDTLIARGNGRSYGDASLNETIFSTLLLNKIIQFDQDLGILNVESGTLISQILELIVPHGFILPVMPGTKFVTVGGAIAADIHGKNHVIEGSFSQLVISFELLVGDGKTILCSREQNPTLFYETCGGMGMTGILLSARLKLKKMDSTFILQSKRMTKNLSELIHHFEVNCKSHYCAAWIDVPSFKGDALKSVFTMGTHVLSSELPEKLKAQPLTFNSYPILNVPFQMPVFVLNPWISHIFNTMYFVLNGKYKKDTYVPMDSFFFPLDKIQNWNRLYGKAGLIQYQFVIPLKHSLEGLQRILSEINKSKEVVYLSVLKRLGKGCDESIMSFPTEGYTLALDFKVKKSLFLLLKRLDEIVVALGGKIYLAKDARMGPEIFEKCYPKTISGYPKFASLLSRRVGMNQPNNKT